MSFIHAMVYIFSFYLSPNENICTIALITIHYLYIITPKRLCIKGYEFHADCSKLHFLGRCRSQRWAHISD